MPRHLAARISAEIKDATSIELTLSLRRFRLR
ncbi:hypothetical protein FHS27_003299 [Rhodopirellula rubra]|uniref:Uncharacterized protein n=1 Tax=Aporhodopirellula rubra TaxID=980271 RepID=A0A7W5E0J8_9BACT|nr:hypothetical protein [Aporhodopirellula rubra]